MLIYILPNKRHQYAQQLNEYFKLRKEVFCDRLGWVGSRDGLHEIDRFDSLFNVYILTIDDATNKVGGGVRLMPTTGPTLLHSAWPDLLDEPREFCCKSIWEATRFCVDESVSTRKSNFINRATISLSLGIAEFGRANNISHVVGVCEKYFFDMADAFGPKAELVSTQCDENGLEIGLGLWSLDQIHDNVGWSRSLTGNVKPAILDQVA